jgi:DNA-binding protein H-NS
MARSYQAIRKQIAKLEAQARALEAARDNKKARAIERVRALMKKLGVTMEDLGTAGRGKGTARGRGRPATKSKPKTTVPPKYRDPETGATWTGRGRAPVWLAGKLAAGRTKEEFLIKSA